MNDFEDEPTQYGNPEENFENQENQENQDNQNGQPIEAQEGSEEQMADLPKFDDNQHNEEIKSGFGREKHKTGNLKENREFTDLAKNHLRTLRRERREVLEKLDQLGDELIRVCLQNAANDEAEESYDTEWEVRNKISKERARLSKINRGINALIDAICFA